MNSLTPPVFQLKDADMRAAPAALVRTARTGTPLILAQHGKMVEETITADLIASVSDKK